MAIAKPLIGMIQAAGDFEQRNAARRHALEVETVHSFPKMTPSPACITRKPSPEANGRSTAFIPRRLRALRTVTIMAAHGCAIVTLRDLVHEGVPGHFGFVGLTLIILPIMTQLVSVALSHAVSLSSAAGPA
jgi:hypothetical protein